MYEASWLGCEIDENCLLVSLSYFIEHLECKLSQQAFAFNERLIKTKKSQTMGFKTTDVNGCENPLNP